MNDPQSVPSTYCTMTMTPAVINLQTAVWGPLINIAVQPRNLTVGLLVPVDIRVGHGLVQIHTTQPPMHCI